METQIQEANGAEVMHMVYETGDIWEIRIDYKERDMQENDFDIGILYCFFFKHVLSYELIPGKGQFIV